MKQIRLINETVDFNISTDRNIKIGSKSYHDLDQIIQTIANYYSEGALCELIEADLREYGKSLTEHGRSSLSKELSMMAEILQDASDLLNDDSSNDEFPFENESLDS